MISFMKTCLGAVAKRIDCIICSIGSGTQCNLCGWIGGKFRQSVQPEKPAPCQICPRCGSYERHRLAFYLLHGNLGSNHNTLHVAPEKVIESWLRAISAEYLSIDLTSSRAIRKMDITNLELEDSSFSLVWCAHVLEHIENDVKAMEEMFRILKPGGTTIVQVPIYGDDTYEDLTIITPEARLKHFKQGDHVRLYGLDVTDRLKSVGFNVEILDISGIPTQAVEQYGLDYPSTREIFICKKNADDPG